MSTSVKNMIYAIVGIAVALFLGLFAFSHNTDSLSEISAFVSAITAGVSIMLAIITLTTKKAQDYKESFVYISFPYNLDTAKLIKIKESFRGYPVCYTDDLFKPGDKVQAVVSDNLKNVHYCFMIISGEMTPRQKSELKELKHIGAKITPVIEGDNTKIPMALQDFQPVSMTSFLLMGKKKASITNNYRS